MVNMINIFHAHGELNENEEIILKYDGGDGETRIRANDKLEKTHGNLKISRTNPKNIIIVDCKAVKYMLIHERWL